MMSATPASQSHHSRPTFGPRGLLHPRVALMLIGLLIAGCNANQSTGRAEPAPQKKLWPWDSEPTRTAKYPDGALPVVYEHASAHSTCLVASVAMAANYLLDERRFSETGIRQDLDRAGLNEMRVGDVKKYLEAQGLHLITLTGQLDGKPPSSLKYWLLQRGYPVICVINRHGDDPDFNHAVVVIGFSPTEGVEPADRIHYLDPASTDRLHSDEPDQFDVLWGRGQRAMMILIAPPAGATD